MLAPCSGIRGGPRKIARPAKWWAWCKQSHIRHFALYCLMQWLYSALCSCFSKLAWQALASTPGAACDLLGEAAAPQAGSRQHQATHKLAYLSFMPLYTIAYVIALCRLFIPCLCRSLYATTAHFDECFRWLLYAVLCCFIPMRGMFRTLLYTALCKRFFDTCFIP